MPGMPRQPGARRCSLCNINYPAVLRFEECPVCGEATTMFGNVFMDEDWLEMATDKAKHWDGDVENLQDWLHAQDNKET